MRALLVHPAFPRTYWGAEHAMRLAGKRSLLPPLGLITVAALLPPAWQLRLRDLNVAPLEEGDLEWADVVLLTGMQIQRDSLREVARAARGLGKRIVVGGAYASSSPEALAAYADCVVVGEAEALIGPLTAALEAGNTLPATLQAAERPDVGCSPVPRYDLLDVNAYHSIGVQFSRGCPFSCEFCDIIEIFGRKTRSKSPQQLCSELDAIHRTGYRGSVFLVDDNFIGNKVMARRLLEPLAAWMRAHGDPFDLYTEASVNLASDEGLTSLMVEAGFTAVFVGIETPSREALRATHKHQNVGVDLDEAVRTLTARGLEVMAGFIVGFDADDADAIERQRVWILRSPIPMAMVGILAALPGTQLERRLRAEGRLLHECTGDNLGRANFITRIDEAELLEGYARLLAEVYEPAAFFDRAARSLELCPTKRARFRHSRLHAAACLARSLFAQGVLAPYRATYWRYLARVLRRAPGRFARAIGLAISGEHLIRYTAEDVLPRLRLALADARARPRAPAARPLASARPARLGA